MVILMRKTYALITNFLGVVKPVLSNKVASKKESPLLNRTTL